MGKDEAVTLSKPEKTSPPVQEQPVAQPYPDWAAMQAYYGPGVPMPSPYFNTAAAPGHPSHPYMWGPQPMIPPFAAPYTAIYPYGVPPNHSVATHVTDVPAKLSNIKDRGLMKKLKGFDGLAVSIGNVDAEITVGDGSGHSQSGDNGAGGLSDASDDNNESGGKGNHRKKNSEDSPTSGDKTNAAPIIPHGVPMCTLPASCQLKVEVHPETWTQDERELKRERRKQSNRESARRSRLRKQAETEELAMKVENIGTENMTLRSEISQLKESLERLKAENSILLEKLKDMHYNSPGKPEDEEAPTVVVENFLSRIDENHESSNPNRNNGKLHQLLNSNPRTDAVAAV